jgi:hypothetical protein
MLVTNYNFDSVLYYFDNQTEFLIWFSNNIDGIESVKHIDKTKDILFIDESTSKLSYAHVRYFNLNEPNKRYREILAYDPSNQSYEGSISEYLVMHSHIIECFDRIGAIQTA